MLDLFMIYNFIRRLVTPFSEWDAYKLGIIDERGKVLRKRRQLRRKEERDAFGVFDVLVLNLKKLLERLPAGQTRIASYAAALWLIREHKAFTSESLLTESCSDEFIESAAASFFNSYTDYTMLNESVKQKASSLDELFEEKFQLNELFDKPYPYKIRHGIGAQRLPETIAKARLSDGTMLEITFRMDDPLDDVWELYFKRGGSIFRTDGGDEFRVFSTVLSVVNDVIKKHSPSVIFFTADEYGDFETRSRLYDRMVSRFANRAGYTAKTENLTGEKKYILTRKVNEDVPTVSVGAGGVSGLTKDDLPGLTRAQQRRHRRRTTKKKKLRDIVGDTL